MQEAGFRDITKFDLIYGSISGSHVVGQVCMYCNQKTAYCPMLIDSDQILTNLRTEWTYDSVAPQHDVENTANDGTDIHVHCLTYFAYFFHDVHRLTQKKQTLTTSDRRTNNVAEQKLLSSMKSYDRLGKVCGGKYLSNSQVLSS